MLNLILVTLLVSAATAQLLFPFPPPTGPTDAETGPFTPEDTTQTRQQAPPPTDVDLVIVGVTSGNRNPEVFLRDDPNRGQWGTEGPRMLNTIGKREALGLGRALRRRYRNIVSERYFPTNFWSTSSTGESECMTAQTVNTGLFPPTERDKFDPSIRGWQPVTVTTENTVLGMSRVERCPTMREALRPVFNGETPEIRAAFRRERTVVDYIVRNTGVGRNMQDLSEVAENLRQLRMRKMRFPDWVENPRLPGYDRERLYRRIQVFRNGMEVACSVYTPCRRMVSGVLVNEIVETIKGTVETRRNTPTNTRPTANDNDNTDRNTLGMVVFTGDVEVILSTFRVFNIGQYNVRTTGGFVLEVTTRGTTPTIRVLTFEPDTTTPENTRFYVPRRTPGRTDCSERPCTIKEFIRGVDSDRIPDYRTACNDNECGVVNPTYRRIDTENDVDVFANPKTMSKGVDCTVARDKFPVGACRALARENYCTRNNFVRNVVCLRTCLCTPTP